MAPGGRPMSLEPLGTPDARPVRWAALMGPALELASAVADTDFVPRALRGNPGAIAACFLYGDELGIGPIQALQSIDSIEGRISPSAALTRALILAAGHSFQIHEATGTRCVVSGLRAGRPESERTRVEWNLEMARSAGLLGKGVWQRYPRAMLLARASSELGNQVFPDVMKGLGGIPDDLATVQETDTWQQEDTPAPPRKRVARKRTQAKSLPAPEPHSPAPSEDQPLPQELVDAVTAGSPHRPPVAPPEPPPGDPWPPLPPAPPAPSEQGGQAADRPMGKGAQRALMASFSAAGVDPSGDRLIRLAITSAVVGRKVDSSNELTHGEALKVISAMTDVEQGRLRIAADADGAPKLVPTQEPPDDQA